MQLIFIHLLQNASGALVLRWKLTDMMLQMYADLTLGFCHKTQTIFVTRNSGNGAQTKRQAVPDRVQQTGMTVQFFEPVFTPCQTILLVNSCLLHFPPNIGQFRSQSLPAVQCLGTDRTTEITS